MKHRRREVRKHEFSYRIALFYVDLDELEELDRLPLFAVNRFGPLRWDRRDYLGDPGVPLDDAVRDRAEHELGRRPTGPVRMLTLVRALGYVFNPVTFYYCHDADGELDAIVAEITNTPWKERHAYVLDAKAPESTAEEVRRTFEKRFHVSPFFAMDHVYAWRFGVPGERLWVHMENSRGGERLFDASLSLERRELTRGSLWRAFLAYPLMPAVATAAIYWQALRLWWKRIPFHGHPRLADAAGMESRIQDARGDESAPVPTSPHRPNRPSRPIRP